MKIRHACTSAVAATAVVLGAHSTWAMAQATGKATTDASSPTLSTRLKEYGGKVREELHVAANAGSRLLRRGEKAAAADLHRAKAALHRDEAQGDGKG